MMKIEKMNYGSQNMLKSKSDRDYCLQNMRGLAPRRHQIVTMYANGYKTQEIADELYISRGSIYNNLNLGHRLYGTRTREQLVAKAVEAGVIEVKNG